MDDKSLEIREYTGEGFQPLIYFGAWRVAVLRWIEEILPEHLTYMERHTQTDEVFVLLQGRATLFLGGTGEKVQAIRTQQMEQGKLYNVKQNAWHTVVMSRDATILLVENGDTGEANSEYWSLTDEQKKTIRGLSEGGF
jgi:hypothetical protein